MSISGSHFDVRSRESCLSYMLRDTFYRYVVCTTLPYIGEILYVLRLLTFTCDYNGKYPLYKYHKINRGIYFTLIYV